MHNSLHLQYLFLGVLTRNFPSTTSNPTWQSKRRFRVPRSQWLARFQGLEVSRIGKWQVYRIPSLHAGFLLDCQGSSRGFAAPTPCTVWGLLPLQFVVLMDKYSTAAEISQKQKEPSWCQTGANLADTHSGPQLHQSRKNAQHAVYQLPYPSLHKNHKAQTGALKHHQ